MVASFYLPVTLTKRTVSSSFSGDGEGDGGGDGNAARSCAADDSDACHGWTAEWDHEQLIALQVGGMRDCHVMSCHAATGLFRPCGTACWLYFCVCVRFLN